MAVTLIVNPGSASKKYSLVSEGRVIASFRFERNEQIYEVCVDYNGEQQKCEGVSFETYGTALRHVLDTAVNSKVIASLHDITHVGVRIVAPGSYFQEHRIVDAVYLDRLRDREAAAPLHVPHTVRELDQLFLELPHAIIVGVSDSAFHATLPAVARLYPIEADDAKTYDIHRFGYHGLSYASLSRQLPTVLGSKASRVIACHIGSGMSMTALKDGVSIDTTMGFGPGSGLMMGARAGDLEPGALLELMRVKNMKFFDTQTYLQTRSGFKGLTGEADFRHLLERYASGDEAATAAFALATYQFQKTIGAFTIALGGLDAIVLTATAAERSSALRAILLSGLAWCGIELDKERNDALVAADGMISKEGAAVPVYVLRTNEFGELLKVTHSFGAA